MRNELWLRIYHRPTSIHIKAEPADIIKIAMSKPSKIFAWKPTPAHALQWRWAEWQPSHLSDVQAALQEAASAEIEAMSSAEPLHQGAPAATSGRGSTAPQVFAQRSPIGERALRTTSPK